jgi:aerobic-type carbon monoxide dehydrogenase small subunit (CoxS/CutS family)
MLDKPEKTEVAGSAPVSLGLVSFFVNGELVEVAAQPFGSLAATLRDELGLTGTKIGCDAGDCGACTVILNDEQVCACLVPTAQADGATIHTVEGPGPDGLTDRLREAFLVHGAAQCGICTPGMLMAAADCLSQTRNPDRRAVEDALGGVLCRCTGYTKIVEAVLDVADAACRRFDVRPTPTLPRQGGGGEVTSVGARLVRVDGRPKVDGTELFGGDFAPADALWMRVVRSPHACASFQLGDLRSVVEDTPGLAAIITAQDIPGENSFGIFPA